MSPGELLIKAKKAREHAYAPYSRFKVGAAVLSRDGQVFVGCNIENASFGATNCAERTAIFAAVAAGVREFAALAVVADTPEPVSPCGICRQVMAEFFLPETPVYLGNLAGAFHQSSVQELLPAAFNAGTLLQKGEFS